MKKLSFCSWSSGKDSCLALFKAINNQYDVKILLTMMSDTSLNSHSHGINSLLLSRQSIQLGIPLVKLYASWDDYEEQFIAEVTDLKKMGIEHGVFGDIDLQPHLDWIIKISRITGINYYEPLWKYNRFDVIKEFLGAGFRAMIVSCDKNKMGEKYLGRDITLELADELASIGVDAAGENGEFHTFVYDGPLFKNRIELTKKDIRIHDNYLFLDIE